MTGNVTFTPSEGDYVAVNRTIYARSQYRRMLFWLGIAAAALAAGEIGFKVLLAGDPLWAAVSDAEITLIFAAIVIGIHWLTPWTIRRQVHKMILQNPALVSPMHCNWDTVGVTFTAANGRTDLEWKTLHRWMETSDMVIFQPSDRMMLFVPKRILGPNRADDLLETMKVGKTGGV